MSSSKRHDSDGGKGQMGIGTGICGGNTAGRRDELRDIGLS
jgi:hypothetical protein